MNKDRRERVKRAYNQLMVVVSILEGVRDDEMTALENLPENFQDSARADALEENADNLDFLIDGVYDVMHDLKDYFDFVR